MATGVDNTELTDAFEEFYRDYYRNEIGELAQKYPNDQKSLWVDWDDLYRFDPDLADDVRNRPEQMQDYAEEALRLYDLPVDVKLGQAHVRFHDLPESEDIRAIRHEHHGMLIAVQGIVRKATDVRPKVTNAAFECQRCGTLTRIPQVAGDFQEPHECQGCERQGPFRLNMDQSEFVDAQKIRVQESPEGLRGGETPQAIDVNIEDDITGEVTAGDHVRVTGVLKLDQQGDDRSQSPMFDLYMDGIDVSIEDEQFEDMDITEEDKKEIIELSNEDDLYDKMVGAIAPSIYGYEREKLAMMLQLFSGVTKHLPDGSRIRGDLHMLLIGDPGTGKCLSGDTHVTLGDGSEVPIRTLVEDNLDDPKPVDDGVWDTVDFEVPSLQEDGTISQQQATKVWKREAPEQLYRIRTATGRELDITPSHPLFVQSNGRFEAVKAEQLTAGQMIACKGNNDETEHGQSTVAADGGVVTAQTDRIESIEPVEPEDEWVYDLEVGGTHNYVSNGVVSHNSQMLSYIQNIAPRSVYTSGKGSSSAGLTAAAVRDDFGDGQQWTLEAGALVLADLGIAAVDELDKMNPDDRSAMHQALEQQEISINKAGINATLKSRCSLLGAANPKYGRFDQFEPIGEQIDLEPALVSRFDLIFTVTDEPDEEEDRNLASHIIQTNYAGELHTHRVENPTSDYSQEQVDAVTEEVAPTIEPDLLRKYVAHAKTSCFPTMTEEAKTEIEDFYVDLRVQGTDEDAAVPVTARKLEALVRLSEASARIRLSDTVEKEDAERATTIARYCMEQIGVDPETGEFDADVVETGTSKSQRDRIQNLKGIISDIEEEYDEGAPVDVVVERAEEVGIEESKAEHEIEKLKQKGEVYEPRTDHLRTT
ncbi:MULTISPECIES: ATP-binding protein [Halomicrobium]|uniref:DNA helicase n=2 Tax=Halomicrobium mukohataei TaxID=57705 RepID=C7P1F9_HALMD|nr:MULTISPECIES: ATP-binding protein [Halomicrobium]ACV47167.1 MCM family protein [Halomicrobium mukohataei DSM 12286]QCD65645.1 AAA family ATPase [Halomicrobium mukohataei]QFR20451.1 AAA family ATPase [Halomicrobium sp. ZPS1]